jgi:hypothetical protein
MTQETGLGSKQDRKAIASTIQRHLDANGLARKDLIREHLSKSSIEKLFQGDFTERTLNKVEAFSKPVFNGRRRGSPRPGTTPRPSRSADMSSTPSNICKETISASARCSPPPPTSMPI